MEDINSGKRGIMADGTEPRIIICCDCKQEFAFTVAAQEYFAERGYTEEPKRCKTCHTKYKKLQRNGRAPAEKQEEVHSID